MSREDEVSTAHSDFLPEMLMLPYRGKVASVFWITWITTCPVDITPPPHPSSICLSGPYSNSHNCQSAKYTHTHTHTLWNRFVWHTWGYTILQLIILLNFNYVDREIILLFKWIKEWMHDFGCMIKRMTKWLLRLHLCTCTRLSWTKSTSWEWWDESCDTVPTNPDRAPVPILN